LKPDQKVYHEVCDLFSLGVLFHQLLLGKGLFMGKTYNEALSANKACLVDLTGAVYKQFNKEAIELMLLLLERDPKKRISAAQAL
jgi:serine/threonine protein kinase